MHTSADYPSVGELKFKPGSVYVPFDAPLDEERGKVYLGYYDIGGVGPSGYVIQVNNQNTVMESLSWRFNRLGTIRTPKGNDLLEINEHQGPRKMMAFNRVVRDGDWVGFEGRFNAASVVLQLTVQDGTTFHTVGFKNLIETGFNVNLKRWNGSGSSLNQQALPSASQQSDLRNSIRTPSRQ